MSLKPEIVEYFEKHNQPVERIIRNRPVELTRAQVEQAIAKLYKKIHNDGLDIAPIHRVWWIWRRAQKIDGGKYAEYQKMVDEYPRNLRKWRRRFSSMKRRKDAEISALNSMIAEIENHLEIYPVHSLLWAVAKKLHFYSIYAW